MKNNLILLILLLSFTANIYLYAEVKEFTIPVEQSSDETVKKKKPAPKSKSLIACENKIKELEEKLSPVDYLFSAMFIIPLIASFFLLFLILKYRVLMNRKKIMEQFEESMIPVRDEITKKEQEIRNLKAKLNSADISSEYKRKIEGLEQTLKEKEDTIIEFINEVTVLKEQGGHSSGGEPGGELSEIEKFKEELEIANKEKLEFLEMIETLQKQLSEINKNGLAAKANSEQPGVDNERVAELEKEVTDLQEELKLYTNIPTRRNTKIETEVTDDDLDQLNLFLSALSSAKKDDEEQIIISQDDLNKLLDEDAEKASIITPENLQALSELVVKIVDERNQYLDLVKSEGGVPVAQPKLNQVVDETPETAMSTTMSQDDLDALLGGGSESKKEESGKGALFIF